MTVNADELREDRTKIILNLGEIDHDFTRVIG